MNKSNTGFFFALAIIATIVALDLLFFRDQPFHRLMANVAVVASYAVIYFGFIKGK